MISNQFGDRGVDRNYDGILQDSEIDVRSQGVVGGYGAPATDTDTSGIGGVQIPMYGGCFESRPNDPSPSETYIPGRQNEFDCKFDTKTGNEWIYDSESGTQRCKLPDDSLLDRSSLQGENYVYPTPEGNKQYKINCEYAPPTTGYIWNEDYLRPGTFKDKTLSETLDSINNGRVADIDIFNEVGVTPTDVIMKVDNQETAVKGIIEESALSTIFFSEQNIDALQQTLCYRVHQDTNIRIGYQSEKELYIIMRSIMLQHANFKVSSESLLHEIQSLNRLVIDYCVKEVGSNVQQYQGYIKDLEKLPTPLDRPSFDETGSRNRTYDLSNHIAPVYTEGWGSRHRDRDEE
jgi:hypothetical protein